MKKYIILLAVFALLANPLATSAAPNSNLFRNVYPEVTNKYENGTSTQAWIDVTSKQFCLTGDSCINTWPTGGGGSSSSTSISGLNSTSFKFATSTGYPFSISTSTGPSTVTFSIPAGPYITVCSLGCNYTTTGTNDQTQINSAITEANAAGGGAVLVKKGSYNVATGTSITMLSNVSLYGEGAGTVVTVNATSTNGVVMSGISNASVQNINIKGSANTSPYGINGGYQIEVINSNNVFIDHNYLTNVNGFGIYMPTTSNSTTSKITITNNIVSGNAHQDLIGGGPNAVGITPAQDIIIANNQFVQNLPAGGTINNNVDANCIDIVQTLRVLITANECYGRIVFGVEKYPNTYSEISNNILDSPTNTSTLVSGSIVIDQTGNPSTATPQSILIAGNIIKNGRIIAQGSTNVNLTGLQIEQNSVTEPSSSYQDDQTSGAIYLNHVTQSQIQNNNMTAAGAGTTGLRMLNTTNTQASNNLVVGFSTCVDGGGGSGVNSVFNQFLNCTTLNNNINRITMATSGNVGIGTDTPGSQLTATGSVQLSNFGAGLAHLSSVGVLSSSAASLTADVSGILPVANGGTGTSSLGSTQLLFGNGTSNIQSTANLAWNNATTPELKIWSGNASNYVDMSFGRTASDVILVVPGGSGQWDPNSSAGDFVARLQSASNKFLFNTTAGVATAALTLFNAQVGVNSSTPISNFTVVGSTTTSTILTVASSTGTSLLTIDQAGNVGIGSSVPTSLLMVQGRAGATTDLLTVSTSTNLTGLKVLANGSYYSMAISSTTIATAAFTVDLSKGNVQSYVLGTTTTLTINNIKAGLRGILNLQQDSTGSRAVTWPSSFHWPAGTAPTLTSSANKVDVITFECYSTGVCFAGSNLNYSP